LSVTVLVSRFVLVGVFALAGLGKLADRDAVRRMVIDFGGPNRLSAPLTWVLIGCELGVAVALAIGPAARLGGFAALALLVVFGAAVGLAIGHGRRPVCHCFGRHRAGEVGWATVARNGLLAGIAVIVVANGHGPLALAALGSIALASWGVVVGSHIAAGTRTAAGSRTAPRLRPGAQAPPVSLVDLDGRTWTLQALLAPRRPLLLVFADPGCGACEELLPDVARWQQLLGSELTIAIVGGGSRADNAPIASEHGLRMVLYDEDRAVAAGYRITATPTAVLVDERRRIASESAEGGEAIAELVARASAPRASAPGASAPDAIAPDRTFERRALLARAAIGLGTVTVLPVISSAAAAARTVSRAVRPKRLKIDGAWLCDQRYALCTFASCKPSKSNKNVSVCRCKVKTGYSVGFKSCEKRAPKGRQLHSNFSLQEVTNRTRVLKCSQRGLWVQCLDVVCEVDRNDPKHAVCQCVNERTKNFYTFGGNCDTRTCKTVIWSATTAPFPGGAQYEKGLRRLGIPFKSPKSCPAPRDA
jgi:uncharacterized membrane protein YphA (DoxX/SURF4 family)/peroxiredoxin